MFFTSAILILAATAGTEQTSDYKTAYRNAMNSDRPLLVLVTAEWCRPCQVMKSTTIPQLKRRFRDYHYATVDFDKHPKLTKQLIKNKGVPQLVLFEKNDNGKWSSRSLVGVQTVPTVEKFLMGRPAEGRSLRTASADQVD